MLEFFRIQLDIKPKKKELESSVSKKRRSLTPNNSTRKKSVRRSLRNDEPNSSEKLIKRGSSRAKKFEGKTRNSKIRKLNENSEDENVITFEPSAKIWKRERFTTEPDNDEKQEPRERSMKRNSSKVAIRTEGSASRTPKKKLKRLSGRKGRISRLEREDMEDNDIEYDAKSPEPRNNTEESSKNGQKGKNPLQRVSDSVSREKQDPITLTNSEVIKSSKRVIG